MLIGGVALILLFGAAKFMQLRAEDRGGRRKTERMKHAPKMTDVVRQNAANKLATSLHNSNKLEKGTAQMAQQAIDDLAQKAAKANPPQPAKFLSDRESAERLVDGIATVNPVVLFMSGTAEAPGDDLTALLIEISQALDLQVKYVNTTTEPDIIPVLHARNDNKPFPHLYVDSQPIGAGTQILDAVRGGTLTTRLAEASIAYNTAQARTTGKPDLTTPAPFASFLLEQRTTHNGQLV